MHTICWIVQTLHFRVRFWFLPQILKSWITEDCKYDSHNIGCLHDDKRPTQMENEVVWTLCEKYGPSQIYAPTWSESRSTAWETSFLKIFHRQASLWLCHTEGKWSHKRSNPSVPAQVRDFERKLIERLLEFVKIFRKDVCCSQFWLWCPFLLTDKENSNVKTFSWWMWTKSRANQHINEYILRQPTPPQYL